MDHFPSTEIDKVDQLTIGSNEDRKNKQIYINTLKICSSDSPSEIMNDMTSQSVED